MMDIEEAARVRLPFSVRGRCFDWPLRRIAAERIDAFWWLLHEATIKKPELREAIDTLAQDPEVMRRLEAYEKNKKMAHRNYGDVARWALR